MDYGVIGEHLTHSFSREIHQEFGDYEYILFELSPVDLSSFIQAKEYKGLNVTIPYKKDVIPYLDHVDPIALDIGAVNTIVNRGGTLYGYNTDFYGMSALIHRTGIQLRGAKVLILGTGGTSLTAMAVARYMGAATIYRVSRHPDGEAISYEQAYSQHTDASIIINTTPVGMYPNTHAIPIDLEKFENCRGVVDAIYNPLRSELVLRAREKGINATGGLYMLVAQAAKACALFLDDDRVLDRVETVYNRIRFQKENVVLIGMPGCGKSTVGMILQKQMGREFLDSDDMIIQTTGKTIPQIFNEEGEAGFRGIERKTIAEISGLTGCIIATGGGAVLDQKNVLDLKKNGQLIFINRPLADLKPTDDRPLSKDCAALARRYQERIPIYRAVADKSVTGNTPEETTRIIKRMWQE